MRKIATLLFICISQFSFAQIDTLNLSSKISDVTVFFSGAQVTRTGNISASKGKHILILDQLPNSLYSESIQISGFLNSTILSVKSESKYYNDSQKSEKTKNVENEIKKLKIKIDRLDGKYDVLKIEEDILLKNSQFSGKEKSVSIAELKEAAEYYRGRLSEIKNSIIDIQIEQEVISKAIKSKYVELNKSIATRKQSYKQIHIAVESKSLTNENFTVKYYVPTAGWIPSYDFRVKDTESPLKIIYNSNVFQSTGEDWNKVNITLSTNNPGISGVKPELRKWTIGRTNTYTNSRTADISENLDYSFGSITGIVSGYQNEPFPFANIILFKEGKQVLVTTTDFDGRYTIKPIPHGVYSLTASYVGLGSKAYTDIGIQGNSVIQRDFNLDEIVPEDATRREITQMAVRSVADITKAAGNGISSRDNGSGYNNVRGARSASSVTFVDGVKIIGSSNLPKSSIEEVSVNMNDYNSYTPDYPDYKAGRINTNNSSKVRTGGLSADYGDVEDINSIVNASRSNLSLEYEVKLPYTIPSDGKEYSLKIKETDIVAEFEYFIVPKVDKDAFLIANIINWEQLNLISGKSNLYYQGTFIGESFIVANQSEDTMRISLGREKSIYISRELNKEVQERQLYSSSIKEYIAWDLVVKNTKNSSVKINVEDQYPTSERKTVEVELTDSQGALINEKTGKLSWTFTLKPNEKKEFGFKYNIKYPKYSNFEIR